jgi:ABC-type phosphate/phosphonate transport system substrate-binding protein
MFPAAVLLGAPNVADAAKPLRLLICQPGGPQLGKEELAVLDKLYRYLEEKLDLEKGQVTGTYVHKTKSCEEALQSEKPAMLMTSLPMFLERRAKLKLVPVAQAKIEGAGSDRFYLVTKAGGEKSAAAFKGKKITGTGLDHPGFVSQVALEGKLGASSEFEIVPAKMGLRAIRAVIKGKADAAILDGFQYRALRGTKFEKELEVVHVSEPVPNAPFAVVKKRIPKGFAKKLAGVLENLHVDPDGASMLKAFRIDGFVTPPVGDWDALAKKMKESK